MNHLEGNISNFDEQRQRFVSENRTGAEVKDRRSDRRLINFLAEHNVSLSPITFERLLLLNKRRVAYEDRGVKPRRSSDSHLQDCFQIKKLVSPDLAVSAMVHDVGKTGPLNATEQTSRLIMKLFVATHKLSPAKNSVLDLLNTIYEDGDKVNTAVGLLSAIGVDANMLLNDFYPLHVEWGEQILKQESGLTGKQKYLALNHHEMWRGKHVDVEGYTPDEEVKKQSRELELADFYQAARKRGKKTREEARIYLRSIFAARMPEPELDQTLDEIIRRDTD